MTSVVSPKLRAQPTALIHAQPRWHHALADTHAMPSPTCSYFFSEKDFEAYDANADVGDGHPESHSHPNHAVKPPPRLLPKLICSRFGCARAHL